MKLVMMKAGEYQTGYDDAGDDEAGHDKTGDDEISGVEWLDSIEHMLEFFGESRTDSCSGLVLASYDQIT